MITQGFKMHTPVFPSDSIAIRRAAAENDRQMTLKANAPGLLSRILEAVDAGEASLTDELYEEARQLLGVTV